MNVRYLLLVFSNFLRGADNTYLQRDEAKALLDLKAKYDVLFDTISPDKKQKWPEFKIEYLKKNHVDIKLQLIEAQCQTRKIEYLLMQTRFKILDALNDGRKAELVVAINAIKRLIEADKNKAAVIWLMVDLQARKEFVKMINESGNLKESTN